MKIPLRADRATVVVGVSLALALSLMLYWVLQFWFIRQGFVEEIESIEPKTSRLLGMVASADQLKAASDIARGRLQELVYGSDRDSATTAAAMQQNIRELMTSAGLSISGSQILPQRKSQKFDRLRLDITAEGNIDALGEALSSLELMRPMVFVEELKITPERSRNRSRNRERPLEDASAGDPRNLTARFQLFSLRMKE